MKTPNFIVFYFNYLIVDIKTINRYGVAFISGYYSNTLFNSIFDIEIEIAK